MSAQVSGYLPNERPPLGQMVLLGFQHVLAMFPAAVFVAAFCGFHVGTVLLASGVSSIVALLLSRRSIGTYIPLFYGSSFSYIAAYLAIITQMTGSLPEFGVPVADEVLSTLQGGIVVTGILNILVGLLIRRMGKDLLDRILPPVVTGSVAATIGFGLAFAALGLAANNWAVAFVTLLLTILFSVYLQNRGFIGMLPVLLGALGGVFFSGIAYPGSVDLSGAAAANLFVMPHFTFPSFSGAFASAAIFSIAIMAIATIPESTAHLYQMSLYIDRYAAKRKTKPYQLDRHVGFNLILDGIGDFLGGLVGSTAGTNYGENNSLMAITRNYSGPVLIAAGAISILLGFFGPLQSLVAAVPAAVTGGLAVYLFGVVGMQGIALMQEHKVDMFTPRNLAIGAVIIVIGIGGNIGYDGSLPIPLFGSVFPFGLPAIATASVVGILLNLIFVLFEPQTTKE
ncbi:MAG: xanthine permease [Anaerolineales bacterium]|nr:xanthine permease [Anaerolineales bacterium]